MADKGRKCDFDGCEETDLKNLSYHPKMISCEAHNSQILGMCALKYASEPQFLQAEKFPSADYRDIDVLVTKWGITSTLKKNNPEFKDQLSEMSNNPEALPLLDLIDVSHFPIKYYAELILRCCIIQHYDCDFIHRMVLSLEKWVDQYYSATLRALCIILIVKRDHNREIQRDMPHTIKKRGSALTEYNAHYENYTPYQDSRILFAKLFTDKTTGKIVILGRYYCLKVLEIFKEELKFNFGQIAVFVWNLMRTDLGTEYEEYKFNYLKALCETCTSAREMLEEYKGKTMPKPYIKFLIDTMNPLVKNAAFGV